jgi:hypothetical protein
MHPVLGAPDLTTEEQIMMMREAAEEEDRRTQYLAHAQAHARAQQALRVAQLQQNAMRRKKGGRAVPDRKRRSTSSSSSSTKTTARANTTKRSGMDWSGLYCFSFGLSTSIWMILSNIHVVLYIDNSRNKKNIAKPTYPDRTSIPRMGIKAAFPPVPPGQQTPVRLPGIINPQTYFFNEWKTTELPRTRIIPLFFLLGYYSLSVTSLHFTLETTHRG